MITTAKNGYSMTIKNEEAAYIAGLFDGEGSIYYTRRPEKKRNTKVKDTEFNSLRLVWKLQ